MIITGNTKYKDFEQYESALNEDNKRDIMAMSEQVFGSCAALTIDGFFDCLNGDFSLLGDLSNPSVLQVYWMKRFVAFCDEFAQSCEKLSIKDPQAESAQVGCVKIQPQESMLIFVREYFGLPSFFGAGKRTIGEYILARKDRYNEHIIRKNMEKQSLNKIKSNGKR